MTLIQRTLWLALLGIATPAAADSQTASAVNAPITTADVFRRFADRTLRIQVVESGSAAKASLGTGFYVSNDGHVVTNYHVISRLVTDAGRYRAEFTDASGAPATLQVMAIDVVNDLALLRTPAAPERFFNLRTVSLARGARLYALGHPRDLGLSIVEGTYNGHLEHTLYPKIHFTGSLNPGMSGGPALAEDGTVVGVNVSTEGNALSYLVPVEQAITLLDKARRPGFFPPVNFMAEVARQLDAYQKSYLSNMFEVGNPTVVIGGYTLPTRPAPFFNCWADAERDDETLYEIVNHQCSTDDQVFISGEQSSGLIEVRHRVISSQRLNAMQFSALHSSEFAVDRTPLYGSESDFTNFACEIRNVGDDAQRFRTQLCVRRYKKLDGLYDAALRVAGIGPRRVALVSTLTMSGVSFDNIQALTLRYLEGIEWSR